MAEREPRWRIAGGPGRNGGRSAAPGAMDPRDALEIEVLRPAPTVILLGVNGEIDMLTSFRLMDAITEAFAEGPALLAVDLSGVRFMDAAGLRVLTLGGPLIEEGQRTRFAVICPADNPIAVLLEPAGAQRELTVHESSAEALRPWLGGGEGAGPAAETALP